MPAAPSIVIVSIVLVVITPHSLDSSSLPLPLLRKIAHVRRCAHHTQLVRLLLAAAREAATDLRRHQDAVDVGGQGLLLSLGLGVGRRNLLV